jgi:pimeloyl-ACP methyl ester carboxylesterase/predicted DCC family thiol-disulfide oxidoreductase YuxK
MPNILYLLTGNGGINSWWEDATPYFRRYTPTPIELPGFGDNTEPPLDSLADYADNLIKHTQPGQAILACGVNALPVLHAAVKYPDHFENIILYGPIGAYLGDRRLPRLLKSKLLQTIAHFMLGHVFWPFRKLFATRQWNGKQINIVKQGYRRCRAFGPYFNIVSPATALSLFDQIKNKITIVWGEQDAVADPRHAAAWESILPQAKLLFHFEPTWGHYPYIEMPHAFVTALEALEGFDAHTKAGRLMLAQTAGIAVPPFALEATDRTTLLTNDGSERWMVRSSSKSEDQWQQSNAGLSSSLLAVPTANVERAVRAIQKDTKTDVIVQRYVEPVVSGVSFVRYQTADIEMVKGHLAALTQGTKTPERRRLSRQGQPWGDPINTTGSYHGMLLSDCFNFLQSIVKAFHYAHLDIEWAWDGERFWCFQLRPVTTYAWHRQLTSANIDEILPKQNSRLVEWAQRAATHSIVSQHAEWDPVVLRDNEPFTDLYQGASYINSDAFLFCLKRWGLPSQLYAHMLGGSAPTFDFNLVRFIKHIPMFLKMHLVSRRQFNHIYHQLLDFENECNDLEKCTHKNEQSIRNWYLRLLVHVVQSNLIINTAIATSMSKSVTSPNRYYDSKKYRPHRVPYETDPASKRSSDQCPPIEPPPVANFLTRWLLTLGLPGTHAYLHNMREWYRDNYTRLYFRLHHVMGKSEIISPNWFRTHPHARTKQGAFWQDNGIATKQDHDIVIYPGEVSGIVGEDILVVDSLEPGQLEYYKKFKAIIARIGGSLSHGAILLRENSIPSAIIPDAPEFEAKTPVRLKVNKLIVQENTGNLSLDAPQQTEKLNSRNTLWFIYDGQCPLCATAAKVYRIREAVGNLQVIDARSDKSHPILIDVLDQGYQLDDGMVIKWNHQYYQGADALVIMALVGSSYGWYNRINAILFRSPFIAQLLYPSLRGTRNLLLKIKGVAPLGSISP